jgi:hypothetical protein
MLRSFARSTAPIPPRATSSPTSRFRAGSAPGPLAGLVSLSAITQDLLNLFPRQTVYQVAFRQPALASNTDAEREPLVVVNVVGIQLNDVAVF